MMGLVFVLFFTGQEEILKFPIRMKCAHQVRPKGSTTSGSGTREIPGQTRSSASNSRGMEEFAEVAERIMNSISAILDKDDSL
jgi:hypothetical protein